MSEALFEVAGAAVTATAVEAAASLILLILLMSLWLAGRKKRSGQTVFAGQVMNGIGFGLIPAIAVWKAFRAMSAGAGAKVTEPLPLIQWLSEEGFYMPVRIETAAAAACFTLLCLWLIFRKSEIPDNGDLFMIAVCLWAAVKLVTEDFRTVPRDWIRYCGCTLIIGGMITWVIRRQKSHAATGRLIADLAATGVCIAGYLTVAKHSVSVGSEIGDFAVRTGCVFLAVMLTLIVGGDLRGKAGKT